MTMLAPTEATKPSSTPVIVALVSLAIIPLNFGVWFLAVDRTSEGIWLILFTALALLQFATGLAAIIGGFVSRKKGGSALAPALLGTMGMLGAGLGWLAGIAAIAVTGMGGAWGRPLRVRGKQLHPELKEGSDWTEGARPSPDGLDEPTRAALEALWLHDAQKEHASVPAFARISWLLAAVGAPADLMAWSHRAGIEEIEHTKLCFALAAGYAGRSFTVEPMPELLLGGLDAKGNALVLLATESLSDGCQLEDFNADVAAACAAVCQEPVTRAALERIAKEERSHADFSWALLEWLLEQDRENVERAVVTALDELDRYPRPTAVSRDKAALVRRAAPQKMLEHGRLPDERWARIWDERLVETRTRVERLIERGKARQKSAA
jgi:hypothetical protein